jgi:hypothetical protein
MIRRQQKGASYKLLRIMGKSKKKAAQQIMNIDFSSRK